MLARQVAGELYIIPQGKARYILDLLKNSVFFLGGGGGQKKSTLK
jgi:hypothetical protein